MAREHAFQEVRLLIEGERAVVGDGASCEGWPEIELGIPPERAARYRAAIESLPGILSVLESAPESRWQAERNGRPDLRTVYFEFANVGWGEVRRKKGIVHGPVLGFSRLMGATDTTSTVRELQGERQLVHLKEDWYIFFHPR